MEAKIFQDTPIAEREAIITANASSQEEMPIQKHFTEEEINEKRRLHINNAIAIKKKMEEFKLFKQGIDEFIKPLAEENAYLLANVRAGYVEVNQQVYLFEDHENGMMNYYDNIGDLVHSRRMLPHERQTRIKANN